MNDVLLRRWLAASLSLWAAGVLIQELVAVAGMAATALAVLVSTALPRAREWRGFVVPWWPLLAFVTWALLAPTVAGRPPSGTGVARTLDWMAVPIAAVAWKTLDARGRRIVLWTAGATFLVSCAVAGLQHFGVWPKPEAFDPLRFTRIPFDRVYERVPGTESRFMAGGLAFHRLKFAHVGGLVVLALVIAALRSQGRARVVAAGAAAVGFLSIALFPYARAATGTLLLACVLAGVLVHPRRARALAGGTALALLAVVLLASVAPLRERFVSGLTDRGSGDRRLLVEAGLTVAREHPLTGIGPGRFRAMDHVPSDAPDHVRTQVGKAHNQLLSMAAETGVPGALLFVGMLILIATRMRPATGHGAFGLSALAFFVLLSLVHDPLFQAPFSLAIVAALGVGAAKDVA